MSEYVVSRSNSETTSGYAVQSSNFDVNIQQTDFFNEIPETGSDTETGSEVKSVCFFCGKDRKQNKGKQQSLHSSNNAKIYEKIIEWMKKLNNEML